MRFKIITFDLSKYFRASG